MQVVNKKLLVVLAAGSLALFGCDSDEGGSGTAGSGGAVGDNGGGGGGGTGDVGGGGGGGTGNVGGGGTGGDPDAGPDSGPDIEEDVDECACGERECGTGPCGDSCGTCGAGEECSPQGQCYVPGNPNGSWCGPTAECPPTLPDGSDNANFADCVEATCDSNLCLGIGAPGVGEFSPVCSRPCDIVKDDVNNATGAPGADGVEDPDTPLSDCEGFVDGPAGDQYVCMNFAPPGFGQVLSYCVPSISGALNECLRDADCAEGEACRFMYKGDQWTSLCRTKIKSGEWGEAVGLGEACNEGDPFADEGLKYCDGGICFGLGCVEYCQEDGDCDTTVGDDTQGCDGGTCKGWDSKTCTVDADCSAMTCRIDGDPITQDGYAPDICWPRECSTDSECADGFYCRNFWNGLEPPDHAWEGLCLPVFDGGAQIGEACDPDPDDNVPGATCENEDYCLGGFCSAVCASDADCGNNQLCTVYELPADLTEPPDDIYEFILPIQWCTTLEGDTSCVSEAGCAEGQRCEPYELANMIEDPDNAGEMILDPDGPYVLAGLCVTSDDTAGAYGAPCNGGADCESGFCLGASATNPGFCTIMCAGAAECPGIQLTDENGAPAESTSRCRTYLYAWGGTADKVSDTVWLPLCVPNPLDSSGDDCSADFTCAEEGETCQPYIVMFGGPANEELPHIDFICQDAANADGSLGTKATGEACDPNLEDAEGNFVNECADALCIEGAETGTGYCSKLCDPEGEACPGELSCLPFTIYPRTGAYADKSGAFWLCQEDTDCTPCLNTSQCNSGRVCANLGQDDDTLADYRCVPGCASDGDCAGQAVTTCAEGTDADGAPVMGCFDTASNYCAQ